MSTQTVTARDTRIRSHDLPLRVKLFPHQEALIYAMLRSEKCRVRHAVLADAPNTGKSIAILSMLYCAAIIFEQRSTTLIVVPFEKLNKWRASCGKVIGELMPWQFLVDYSAVMALSEPADIMVTSNLFYRAVLDNLNFVVNRVILYDAHDLRFDHGEIVSKVERVWTVSHIKKIAPDVPRIACDEDFIRDNIRTLLPPPEEKVVQVACEWFWALHDCVHSSYRARLHAMDYGPLLHQLPDGVRGTVESEKSAVRCVVQGLKDLKLELLCKMSDCKMSMGKYLSKGMPADAKGVEAAMLKHKRDYDICLLREKRLQSVVAAESQSYGKLHALEELVVEICKSSDENFFVVYSEYSYVFDVIERSELLARVSVSRSPNRFEGAARNKMLLLDVDARLPPEPDWATAVTHMIFMHDTSMYEALLETAQAYGRIHPLRVWQLRYVR